MSSKLKLGVCQKDITPSVGGHLFGYSPDILSESINDNLTLTAFAFSQCDKKVLMISVCIGSINTDLQNSLRKQISEKTGIDYKNIIICSTHTHSAPNLTGTVGWGDIDYDYYNSIFLPAILKSAEEAYKSLQDVTVGFGKGLSDIGVNRRELTIENYIALGQNPWGPYDPEMNIISFKNDNNEIVANIITYGLHGTCAGYNHEITRDWSGFMVDTISKASGGITAFFNGLEGDVGPRISNGKTTGYGDIKFAYELGEKASADALEIYKTITDFSDVSIDIYSEDLKIPLKKRVPLEYAKEKIKEFNPEHFNWVKQSYEYYKSVIDSYEIDYKEAEYKTLPQTIFRLGNVIFATFPGEIFSEVGLRIKKAIPDFNVISLALANGSFGYFPTKDQICRGGYEITMFLQHNIQGYSDDTDFHFVEQTLKNIEHIRSNNK